MTWETIAITIVSVLIALGVLSLFVWIRRPSPPAKEYAHKEAFAFLTAEETLPELDSGTSWAQEMSELGDELSSQKVAQVLFIHGTFVGEDPIGAIRIFESSFSSVPAKLIDKMRRLVKNQSDIFLQDSANFHPSYVELFAKATKLPSGSFNWSSGNNHLDRLTAAADLVLRVSQEVSERKLQSDRRILLMAHSHGGNVLALLTHLIYRSEFQRPLLKILHEAGYATEELRFHIRQVARVKLDLITLGTPFRYPWAHCEQYQLINMINHRGQHQKGGEWSGILHTKSGDYIQQLGITGTDMIATISANRKLNKKLDDLLSPGVNWKLWLDAVKHKMRVPPFGKTILIDYLDSSKIIPNLGLTFFGHGAYTRKKFMLFNLRTIVKFLYSIDLDLLSDKEKK